METKWSHGTNLHELCHRHHFGRFGRATGEAADETSLFLLISYCWFCLVVRVSFPQFLTMWRPGTRRHHTGGREEESSGAARRARVGGARKSHAKKRGKKWPAVFDVLASCRLSLFFRAEKKVDGCAAAFREKIWWWNWLVVFWKKSEATRKREQKTFQEGEGGVLGLEKESNHPKNLHFCKIAVLESFWIGH